MKDLLHDRPDDIPTSPELLVRASEIERLRKTLQMFRSDILRTVEQLDEDLERLNQQLTQGSR